jgi:hypothetical protein
MKDQLRKAEVGAPAYAENTGLPARAAIRGPRPNRPQPGGPGERARSAGGGLRGRPGPVGLEELVWAGGEKRGAEVEVALRHTRRTMGLPAQAAVCGPRRNRRGREEAGSEDGVRGNCDAGILQEPVRKPWTVMRHADMRVRGVCAATR